MKTILDLCKERGSVLKVYLALCTLSHLHSNKTFKSSAEEVMEYSHTGRVQTQQAINRLIMLQLVGRRIFKVKEGINRATYSWYRVRKILTPYPQVINSIPF